MHMTCWTAHNCKFELYGLITVPFHLVLAKRIFVPFSVQQDGKIYSSYPSYWSKLLKLA